MQLSMAIALGRVVLRPWSYEDGKFLAGPGTGCAMMMAAVAVNGDDAAYFNWTHKDWGWLHQTEANLPCECSKGFGGGMDVVDRSLLESSWQSAVIHLFNDHVVMRKDWTLDQLIDWVRSVEPPLQTLQQIQTVDALMPATVLA